MKKLLTMFAIACAFLASCDSEGGDLNRTPLLKVVGPDGSDPSQPISIDGKSQEVAFTVLATTDWTADIAGDEGFALSDRSGATGNTKVTVVAARNLSGATRSATVSFRLGGEERYAYTISQTEEQPYLDVTPAVVTLVGDPSEFTVAVSTNQSSWKVEIDSPDGDGWLTQQSKESASITFLAEENTTGRNRTATLKFVSELHPEVFNYVTVTQGYVVPAPTADLLDVVFAEDGTAKDVSAMGMTVDASCLDETVSTAYNEKFQRYVAVFDRQATTAAKEKGYYKVPYTDRKDFAQKLEDGFSMELLVCRYDDPIKQQIKPFASTQAGGTGICFRNHADNEINFEVHTGGTRTGDGYKFTGGGWRELYSGITPVKGTWYHVIGTWNKQTGQAQLFVNGVLTTTVNAAGEFDHMVSNVNAYWFGIGADPNASDKGELFFNGEVAIARLYDDPINADQVYALWKLVK